MDSPVIDETGSADAPLAPAPTSAGEPVAPAGSGEASPDTTAPTDVSRGAPPSGVDAGDSCTAIGGFSISEGDSCYRVGDSALDWQDARSFCQAWGGDLVTIDSPGENRELAQRIDASVWIGANDQEAEGTFQWADGAPLGFARWSADQPNNLQGNEDCTEIRPFDGRWTDVPCSGEVAIRPLCERP